MGEEWSFWHVFNIYDVEDFKLVGWKKGEPTTRKLLNRLREQFWYLDFRSYGPGSSIKEIQVRDKR